MEIPEIKIEQTFVKKDLQLRVVFTFADDERIYWGAYTILRGENNPIAREAEIAFQIGRIFNSIYENIAHDNAKNIK